MSKKVVIMVVSWAKSPEGGRLVGKVHGFLLLSAKEALHFASLSVFASPGKAHSGTYGA